MKKWIQTENYKVKRKGKVLNIGDYIDYHDCAGENGKDLYEGKWQVLGVSDTGNLLIVSEENVTTHNFNAENTLEGAMEAYSKGKAVLDKICEPYAKGTYAISARSICIEDIDKLTRYDKTKNVEYGKIRIYKNQKGDTFLWHNGQKWKQTKLNKNIELQYTYYWYDALETSLSSVQNVYDMLFGKEYLLASSYVGSYSSYVGFGLNLVINNLVAGHSFVFSNGYFDTISFGVRAIVMLEDNIKI